MGPALAHPRPQGAFVPRILKASEGAFAPRNSAAPSNIGQTTGAAALYYQSRSSFYLNLDVSRTRA